MSLEYSFFISLNFCAKWSLTDFTASDSHFLISSCFITGDEISPGDILIESLAEGVSAPVDVAAFGLKKASEKLKTSQGTENSETRVSPDETELFSAQDLEDLQNKNDEEDEISNNCYYNPIILTNIKKGNLIYEEEIFGPVL